MSCNVHGNATRVTHKNEFFFSFFGKKKTKFFQLTTEIQLVDDIPAFGFKEKLASWAVKYRVKQNAVDGLFKK